MKRSRQLKVAGGIAVLLLSAGVTTAVTFADSSPVLSSEVPTSIPSNGVNINNQVTLTPFTTPTGTSANASPLSAMQALTIARSYVNAQNFPATTVEADVTLPGSVPPSGATDTSEATMIQNVPSWVVTFTSPTPTAVDQGGYFPNATTPANETPMSHFSVVINAQTGQFVMGFFTQ